jgi:hypothetical protein
MSNSQDVLKKYVSGKGRYFMVKEGEEITVKYLFSEIVPNYFSKDKADIIRYHLEVDGVQKFWDRASRELAMQMSEIPEGSMITISRTGEGNKTKYKIKRLEE